MSKKLHIAGAAGVLMTLAATVPSTQARPPGIGTDGTGPIVVVAPPDRVSCAGVDSTTLSRYPKKPGVFKQTPSAGASGGPADVTYVDRPLLPGGVVQISPTKAGGQRLCVQPFVVNSSADDSPAGAQMYITLSPTGSAATHPERDQPLLASRRTGQLLSTTFGAVNGKGIQVTKEAWCTQLGASEVGKVDVSLYLEAPAHDLRMAARRVAPAGAVASQASAPSATWRLEGYRTMCKLDEVQPENKEAPQTRRLAASAPWPAGVTVREALRAVSSTPRAAHEAAPVGTTSK
jgi:hypothetical protein